MLSFFKVSLLVIFFVVTIFTTSFAQLPWIKDANYPIITGGGSGTWNRLAMMPNVLYNSDSLSYEMWYSGWLSPAPPNLISIRHATAPLN